MSSSSRSSTLFSFVPLLLPLLLLTSQVEAALTAPKSLPNVDYSSLGTVGLLGNYAGLQFYDKDAPVSQSSSSDSSTQGHAFVRRSSSGSLTVVGRTNDGGRINTLCQTNDGTIYLAGLFSSIADTDTQNIAAYDPSSGSFTAYTDGPDGEILTLECDNDGSRLLVGGTFASPSPNAAILPLADSTTPAPGEILQGGFAAPVRAINRQGDSVFIGGDFIVNFAGGNTTSVLNATTDAGGGTITNPGNGNASTFPSIGSSLVPVLIPSSADTFASPTTYRSGFGLWSYTFCPQDEDGPGSSWLLTDNSEGFINIDLGTAVNARGIRLGNTFFQGRGTREFHLVSLPDNQPIPLTYSTDPANPDAPRETCTDSCILQHDEAIPFEDFLFDADTPLSGVQLVITDHYGAGGGLHLFQILSSGSMSPAAAGAAADADDQGGACTTGLGAQAGVSNITQSGGWQTGMLNVQNIPGARDNAMISHDAGDTLTWTPFIAADGFYNISLFTPGCADSQVSCDFRGSVTVNVQPGGQETVIDQNSPTDITTQIFAGQLSQSDPVTITMTNTDGRTAIADYIQLSAQNPSTPRGANLQVGRALYEWVQDGTTGNFGDGIAGATSTNSTNATAFDVLGRTMNTDASVRIIVSTADTIFIGGNFTYTASDNTTTLTNFLTYSGPDVATPAVPAGGLNGPVSAMVEYDGWIYVAGEFDSSADASVSNLNGIARWNYNTDGSSWEAIDSDGSATPSEGTAWLLHANVDDKDIIVAVGSGENSLATYDPSEESWDAINAGFIVGSVSTAIESTADTHNDDDDDSDDDRDSIYLAGDITSVFGLAAPGSAILSQQSNKQAELVPLNYTITDDSQSSQLTTNSATRRSLMKTKSLLLDARSIIKTIKNYVSLKPRAPAPVSLDIPFPGIASGNLEINSGAFWSNSSDDDTQVAIIGGRFETSNGINNIGVYDSSSDGALSALPNLDIQGRVAALKVLADTLWIGGNLTFPRGTQGLGLYDLKNNELSSSPNVTAYDNSQVSINFIGSRSNDEDSNVIVAGAFESIGALPCYSVCEWDAKTDMWNAVGAGLQGIVASADFAGDHNDYLVVAGTFQINGTVSHVALWNFKDEEWSALGEHEDIPGPATAVSVDDYNVDKIFVAGQADGSGDPYLMYWNGSAWSDVNQGGLERGSGVQQLIFVPLEDDHDKNDIVESNRMLMVSGSLSLGDGIGNVSSALFDGETWYGYLMSATSSGAAGTIASLFYSATGFRLSDSDKLAVGLVILISIAVSLGIVFLLVLIGLFIALRHRQKEEQNIGYPVPIPVHQDSIDDSRHRPTSLLATLNAATVMMAEKDPKGKEYPADRSPSSSIGDDHHAGAVGAAAAAAAAAAATAPNNNNNNLNNSNNKSLAGPSNDRTDGAALYGDLYPDDDEAGPTEQFETCARYSFDAERDGELSLRTNDPILVLDTSDSQWWLAQLSTGERGVVPAACLL